MRYQSTIFETLLKEFPHHRFDRLVAHHNSDYRSRHLSSWRHLVTMIFAQLSGAQSLRDLEHGLNSHSNLFYHLGIGPVRRSTLADANVHRSSDLFEDVFGLLLGRLQGQLRRQIKEGIEVLRLLDATLLPLPQGRAHWARSWIGKKAAKAHVVYDPVADMPVYCAVEEARINDIVEAKKMPIEAGATYVFDRGYYDFAWWAKLSAHGCRFVTRLKKNSPVNVIKEYPVTAENVQSDRLFTLNERMSRSRRNPYQQPLREVVVSADNGKKLRLVTNDLESPAEEIAELYKMRWQIELFFKWVKQNLRIKRFLGTSRNAVKIQIATALIAYLLIRLAKQKAPKGLSMQTLSRLIRANLLHRKPWAKLFEPPPEPKQRRTQNPQIAWSF